MAAAFLLAPIMALAAAAGTVVLLPAEAAVSAIYYALFAVFTALVYARLREVKEGLSTAEIAATIE